MNGQRPAAPVHVVNACRFAMVTLHTHKAARAYRARTGRHAAMCGNCGKYHA